MVEKYFGSIPAGRTCREPVATPPITKNAVVLGDTVELLAYHGLAHPSIFAPGTPMPP